MFNEILFFCRTVLFLYFTRLPKIFYLLIDNSKIVFYSFNKLQVLIEIYVMKRCT